MHLFAEDRCWKRQWLFYPMKNEECRRKAGNEKLAGNENKKKKKGQTETIQKRIQFLTETNYPKKHTPINTFPPAIIGQIQ